MLVDKKNIDSASIRFTWKSRLSGRRQTDVLYLFFSFLLLNSLSKLSVTFLVLDDHLSGNAVQHREVEGNESERFLSYFKSRGGITYRQGGIASGFHKHQSTSEPRLFRLKGRHNVRLFEMPSIDWSHITRGDVYLLDLNEVIFIWNGARSNKYERLQAMQRARQLRDERGQANIVIIEDGEETKMSKDELKFFESKLLLREKMSKLNTTETPDELDDDKRYDAAHIKLYKCSDESGTLKVTEKKAGPLLKSDLESEVTSESSVDQHEHSSF